MQKDYIPEAIQIVDLITDLITGGAKVSEMHDKISSLLKQQSSQTPAAEKMDLHLFPLVAGEAVWAIMDGKAHAVMFRKYLEDGMVEIYNGDRIDQWKCHVVPAYPAALPVVTQEAEIIKSLYDALRSIIRQIPNDENLADWYFDLAEAAEEKAISYLKSKNIDIAFNYSPTQVIPVVSGGEKMYRWVNEKDNPPKDNLLRHQIKVDGCPDLGWYNKETKLWVDEDNVAIYGSIEWLEEVSPSQLPSPVTQMIWHKNMDVFIKAWIEKMMVTAGLGMPSTTFPEKPESKFFELISNTWGEQREKWLCESSPVTPVRSAEEVKKYLNHLPTCNINQNWDEAFQALSDTPDHLKDDSWQRAYDETFEKKSKCTCGLTEMQKIKK